MGKQPKRSRLEVVPKQGDWTVTQDGKRLETFERKDDAVKAGAARGRAIQGAGGLAELTIKKQDGTIQDKRTYGEDPNPPKG